MKSHAPSITWMHRHWTDDPAVAAQNDRAPQAASMAPATSETELCDRAMSGGLSAPLRIVGILAFCQAIFFLAFFLFVCARVGAATPGKSASALELTLSTYTTQTQRDPFGSEGSKSSGATGSASAGPVDAASLKLMGILYSAASPSALVNNQLVELNKPVKMQIGQGAAEVKAVAITRDSVVLELEGKRVELHLGASERQKTDK
jgi:hypothetical protein